MYTDRQIRKEKGNIYEIRGSDLVRVYVCARDLRGLMKLRGCLAGGVSPLKKTEQRLVPIYRIHWTK